MPSPERLALLVGVDRYRNLQAHAQLRSCVNDARLLADTLVRGYGFHAHAVTLLLDEAATREGILAGLASLRARARPNDAVVFYFSGHGSRVADGDKPGGWHETIVPHDSGRDPEPNRDIADDEIYGWLLEISEATRNVVVIADTCFAGGSVRGGREAREKWIDPDPRPRPGAAVRAVHRRTPGAGFRDAGPSGFLPLDERYVLLAACRAGEHAKELRTRALSVFTHFLCEELLRGPAEATYREVVEQVRLAVEHEVRDQTPQVEGARDRVLFGEMTGRPAPYLPLLARQGEAVELGGGAVHGVDPGSLWAVYPAGTRRPGPADALGLVRIESAQAVRSRGVIVEESQGISAGARAFRRAPGPRWLRLAVALPQGGRERAAETALAAALARSPLLVLVGSEEATAVRIAAAEPMPRAAAAGGTEEAAQDGRLRIRVEEPSWIVVSVEGELLLPPIGRRWLDATARLVHGLENLARARNLLALAPGADDPKACAPAELQLELLRSRGGGPYLPALADGGGEVVYREGDRLALRVTHQAERPLHLHVLDIGLLGAVTPLYPVPGASEVLVSGQRFEIGTRPGETLTVRIPADFAAMARATGRHHLEGREALKVFVTADDADLSGWQQPGYRGEERTAPSGSPRLAALLARARGDAPTRDGSAVPVAGDRWSTRTLTFLVRGERAGERG